MNSVTSYTYDNVNRLKSVNEADGSTISYDFDKSGNIIAKTMTHPADYVFTYSENGTEHTMSNIFMHKLLYVYNKNNELLQEQNWAAGTGEHFSGLKELVTYYAYDMNGNTLSRTNDIYTQSYTYDLLNRLKAYKRGGHCYKLFL